MTTERTDAVALALSLRPDIIGRAEADALLVRAVDPLRTVARAADGESLATRLEHVEVPESTPADVRAWIERRTDFEAHLDADRRIAGQRFPLPVSRIRAHDAAKRTIEHEDAGGIRLTELLAGADARAIGVNVENVAEELMQRTLESIFEARLFLDALHPADLAVADRDTLVVHTPVTATGIDDALVGDVLRVHRAIRDGSPHRATSALIDLLGCRDAAGEPAFRRDVKSLLRAVIAGDTAVETARTIFAVSETIIEVLRLANQHAIAIPRTILFAALNLVTTERVARLLGTTVTLRELARDFFDELQLRRALDASGAGDLRASGLDLLTLLRNAPGNLHAILSDLADERFRLRVVTSDSDEDRALKNLRARMIAAAITAAALVLLMAAPSMPRAGTILLIVPLLLNVAWLAVAWRRLR